jgi:hypothetical protein
MIFYTHLEYQQRDRNSSTAVEPAGSKPVIWAKPVISREEEEEILQMDLRQTHPTRKLCYEEETPSDEVASPSVGMG